MTLQLVRFENRLRWMERRAVNGGFLPSEMEPSPLAICATPWESIKAAMQRYGYTYLHGTPSKTHYQILVRTPKGQRFTFWCAKEHL